MPIRQLLYQNLIENKEQITETWLNTRKTGDSESVYSASAPKSIELQLREENQELITAISKVFIEAEDSYKEEIIDWAVKVSQNRAFNGTDIHIIINQFKIFRQIYWRFVQEFISKYESEVKPTQVAKWSDELNYLFDQVIEIFIENYQEVTDKLLKNQQQMIYELSSPVIPVTTEVGVLPLVGDIDTHRAKLILESTLQQCLDKKIQTLFIDLSGVPIIDTMVAQQIFHVLSALRLVGVQAVLSGIRPEVAQTAIQLGLEFHDVPIRPSLAIALKELGFSK